MKPLLIFCTLLCATLVHSQNGRRVGKLTEVYAWRQLSYNINGNILSRDTPSFESLNNDRRRRDRVRRQYDSIYFQDNHDEEREWNKPYPMGEFNEATTQRSQSNLVFDNSGFYKRKEPRPVLSEVTEDASNFFIQYNNVPMGAEKVGNRLFITVPRRRYGIPSTLNYIDLDSERSRSPSLKPYPNLNDARSLVSVYRTRADECGRLWMVDTGLLEIPDNPQQVQRPSIVVYDLRTDRQIMKYELKDSDVPANNTPTGLASITLDTSSGCSDTFAYIPDLTTYGLIVFSLRLRDSWRITHNYFHFNPVAANLNIAGQRFQWNDGIFSLALSPDGCRTAYFHPMISHQEFSVSTCVLRNRTAASDSSLWEQFNIVGDRGPGSQCTMHDIHSRSATMFFADIGRDAISCWNTRTPLTTQSVAVLAQDQTRLSYPSDLHVTGDEVWVMSNTLPRFGYAQLDRNLYNFYVYSGTVADLVAGTVCADESVSSSNNNKNHYYG